MKTYKSSDLTHKRAKVFEEAEKNGVIIQVRKTNGDVMKEFVLCTKDKYMGINHSSHECSDPHCQECSYDY